MWSDLIRRLWARDRSIISVLPAEDRQAGTSFYDELSKSTSCELAVTVPIDGWHSNRLVFQTNAVKSCGGWLLAWDADDDTNVFILHSDGRVWCHDLFLEDNPSYVPRLCKEYRSASGKDLKVTNFVGRSFIASSFTEFVRHFR